MFTANCLDGSCGDKCVPSPRGKLSVPISMLNIDNIDRKQSLCLLDRSLQELGNAKCWWALEKDVLAYFQ